VPYLHHRVTVTGCWLLKTRAGFRWMANVNGVISNLPRTADLEAG